MIEAVRKRYKVGDTITLHTSDASFTGKLDAFEDTCVILITEEGEEFIANEDVKRVSVPKPSFINTNQIVVLPPPIEVKTKVEIVKEEPIKTETKQQIIEAKPLIPQYKVGDKIPLDILDKRTDKKVQPHKIKPPKIKGKTILTLGSLSDLRQLILPELEAENKINVPANGTIKSYVSDRGFGFILDKNGYEIFFGYSSIIEQQLYDLLKGQSRYANIPVLFSIGKNKKGDKALFIHKPKTVEQVLSLAKKYFEDTETETAIALVDQVLLSFPNNYTAINLKEEIKIHVLKSKNHHSSNTIYKSYDPNYQKATKAKNKDKNFEEAVKYYILALQNNEKRESCIKDIAMLYITLGELEKALEFTRKYENELPDTLPNNNHLYNFYRALAVKGLDVNDDLLNITNLLIQDTSPTNKARYTELLTSKAFVLIQLKEFEEAREVLEEAISIQPDNTYASRLLQALDSPNDQELSQILNDAEYETLGAGGVSRLIKDTLNNYNEFNGVPPKIVETGDFTKDTLNSIRNLIERAGRARPSERANYLLTEAKLLEQLEPDNNNDLKSVLARYCNAMALNSMYEKYSLDVVRTFYLEAFQLEESWDSTRRQFVLYLISLNNNLQELINFNSELSGKEVSNQIFSEILFKTLSGDKFEIWNNLLNVFWVNSVLASKSLKLIFDKKELKKKGIDFLINLGYEVSYSCEFEDFSEVWNQAREKRQRDYSRWHASIKAIYANENIETLANQLYDSLNDAKKNWLTQLDISRLNTILTDISDVINQYLRQSGYRDKERLCGIAKAQVNQLISEIKEKPTKFSYEGFIPLLEKIELLLDKSFKTVEAASTPKVKISILGESRVVGNDNIVPFQVTVENSKDSSPIRDIKIIVQNNNEISFIEENNKHYDSIDGGENCILKLIVNVSEKVKQDKATTLNIICEYKIRNQEEPVSIKEQLSLRLYSEEEFEIIENAYAPIADGGPVENKKMFFGRDEFIKNRITAILNADSKQIIIYGQKRSGKSSVLYHLKRGLEETKQTFCVSFSLGLIIKDLNEFTFYHKILSTIERELRLRKAKGEIVPVFICPSLEEFKLILF